MLTTILPRGSARGVLLTAGANLWEAIGCLVMLREQPRREGTPGRGEGAAAAKEPTAAAADDNAISKGFAG